MSDASDATRELRAVLLLVVGGLAAFAVWVLLAEWSWDGRARSLWPAYVAGFVLAAAAVLVGRRRVGTVVAVGAVAASVALAGAGAWMFANAGEGHCGPTAEAASWQDAALYAALEPGRAFVPTTETPASEGFAVDLSPYGFPRGASLVRLTYLPSDLAGADLGTEGLEVTPNGTVLARFYSEVPPEWTSVRDGFLAVTENLTAAPLQEREQWAAGFIGSVRSQPYAHSTDAGRTVTITETRYEGVLPADAGRLLAAYPWQVGSRGFVPQAGWTLTLDVPHRAAELDGLKVRVDAWGAAKATGLGHDDGALLVEDVRRRLQEAGLPAPEAQAVQVLVSVC